MLKLDKPQPEAVRPVRDSRRHRLHRRHWALCALLATATLANARSDDGPAVKVSATSSASITLDGLLNEPAWRDAPVMKLTQQAPKPGQPTPYETQVQVIVTNDRIYFGFTCKDPDPRHIAIHTMRRDGDLTGDDTVSIVLDTYGDRRTGYFFQINAARDPRRRSDFHCGQCLARLGWYLGCAHRKDAGWLVGGDCHSITHLEFHSRP